MAWCQFGTKPLSKPVMTYHLQHPILWYLTEIVSRFRSFHSTNCSKIIVCSITAILAQGRAVDMLWSQIITGLHCLTWGRTLSLQVNTEEMKMYLSCYNFIEICFVGCLSQICDNVAKSLRSMAKMITNTSHFDMPLCCMISLHTFWERWHTGKKGNICRKHIETVRIKSWDHLQKECW